MSIVINANNNKERKFNNDFLIYYKDFNQYLFLPELPSSLSLNSGTTPNSLNTYFSVNGTVVNYGCRRLYIDNTSSPEAKLIFSSSSKNATFLGDLKTISSENMGSIRVGDLAQFLGGEVFSKLMRKFPRITLKFSNTGLSKIRNPNYTINFTFGLLHIDGTITEIGIIEKNLNATGDYNSLQFPDCDKLIIQNFSEVVARNGDRFVMTISSRLNNAQYYHGYGGAQNLQSFIEVLFDTTIPVMQWFI